MKHKKTDIFLAFLIPFVTVFIAFICQGLWPFGDRGVSIIDSYHQYVPFFSELQYKWRNFDSLFYTWNGGLGTNFWAIIAYYLASPLNLLLLVFPKSMVMECFALIYFLKIGLCGASFAWFLHKRFDGQGISITIFGCFYALSSFVIGYGWNIMWLDCIYLFPLIMYGIHQLIHEGKGLVYGLCLAASIFINYYISIMICIFVCFDLVLEVTCASHVSPLKRIKRIGGFIWYSLLAGGTAAIMLFPAATILLESQSSKTSFPTSLKFYQDIFQLLCQHFSYIEPTNLTGNFNLYCGTAFLIWVPMYLFNRKIKLWDRCSTMLLTIFLLVSLNTNYLTYIWHGFHFPNGLPGRYSFIYIFMILLMGYEGYKERKYCLKGVPIIATLGWLLFLCFSRFGDKVQFETYVWIVNIILIVLYGLCIYVECEFKVRKAWIQNFLWILMLIEITGYGIFGLCMNGTVNRKDYYSDQKEILTLKQEIEEKEKNSFYRVELEERRGRDDVTWHNLPGLSLFSSTADAGVDHILKRLGFYAVTNKYSYEGSTPETDALFNIKYLISKKEEDSIRTFKKLDSTDTRYLYTNPYALSLGIMVPRTVFQWDYEHTNPFETINQMVRSMTQIETDAYEYFGLSVSAIEGCIFNEDTWADYSYTRQDSEDGKIEFSYRSDRDQELYIYFKAPHCNSIQVLRGSDSKNYTDEDGHIIFVGDVKNGEEIRFLFDLDETYSDGTIKLIAASHNPEVFEQFYASLQDEQWIIEEKESTHLKGKIQANQDGWMMTTIPYEKGWRVKIDGKQVSTVSIADAFIAVPVTEGMHEIEMEYECPGFKVGSMITVVSLVLLGVSYIIENRKEKSLKIL